MKKILLFNILIIIGVFTVIAYASVTLQYFTGKTNADGILLEWKTIDESGTSYFDIERSANTPDNFVSIKQISATGNNSYYTYQDNGVNLNQRTSSIYYYRLKCVTSSSSYSYTYTISVTHSISGIKSTWGSIKAIFR
jgi:hypothetical protein